MPHITSTNEYFDIVKENHKEFLEKNMNTSLMLYAEDRPRGLIKKCLRHIKSYHQFKEVYLNHSIEQQSLASRAGHGALAALIGAGVGGLTFFATKSSSVAEAFSPIAGANDAAAGAFSALIGAAAGTITYKIWESTSRNPAYDDFEKFKEGMEKLGFNDKKYNELSAEIVKLFHFRECLLLDLKDNLEVHFRAEFKEKYTASDDEIPDDIIDTAIEVHFVEQLNILFNDAFKNIYKIQDAAIKEEEEQAKILTWIKGIFEDEEERKKFTQQLQVLFLEQCINYLQQQMLEPGFLASYPLVSTSITGLITAAATFFCISAFSSLLTMPCLCFAFLSSTISMPLFYTAINYLDYFRYERDEENRLAISKTIVNISKEYNRLKNLIKNVTETTKQDFQGLGVHKNKTTSQHLLYTSDRCVAAGSHVAWAREYASRYRHSKEIEIDLKNDHKTIIKTSKAQTSNLQMYLHDILTRPDSSTTKQNEKLTKFIDQTRQYLLHQDNQDFIKNFEIVNKIKEQILDIISAMPNIIPEKLPKKLIKFYTDPIDTGGLNGLYHNLNLVTKIAPNVISKFEYKNPYNVLLNTAQKMNFYLITNKNSELVLSGDENYRKMLGLNLSHTNQNISRKINSSNINKYLSASFDFLYSLDKSRSIDEPIKHSFEFILYQTILLKQLSEFINPNNLSVENSIKQEIILFIKKKLKINPEIVIDDVFNQSLFANPKTSKCSEYIKDPLGNQILICDLEFICEAIRLNLAYNSSHVTAKMLINLEAKEFLYNKNYDAILFGYHKDAELTPDMSEQFFSKLLYTIILSREFILHIMDKNLLGNMSCINYYLDHCLQEMAKIFENITSLTNLIAINKMPSYNKFYIKSATKVLQDFYNEVSDMSIIINKQLEFSNKHHMISR